jgi:hypothetical protein
MRVQLGASVERHSGRLCEQQLPGARSDRELEARWIERKGAEERRRARPSCRGQRKVGVELEAAGVDEGGGVGLCRNLVERVEHARARVGRELGRAGRALTLDYGRQRRRDAGGLVGQVARVTIRA